MAIALTEARGAGLWGRRHWGRNLVSGLIVGVVALPLSMAFAIASGARPEQGIYTAIVASVAVSLFGGTRVQIAGPTGAFVVILADVTREHGTEGLQVATLLAGLMLVLMGISRLGAVIRFIPDPVITGFTAGIGVVIWVGQWKEFFGLPAVGGSHFHEKVGALILALPSFHAPTTLLAVLGLALTLWSSRVWGLRRIPGPLVALVVLTIVHATGSFDGVATIGSAYGGIPPGLPSVALPASSLDRVIELLGPAFTIAILGAIESLLSAVVADSMAGTRHDANQELVGQGIANVLSPLLGGFAATGAIARTATNIRNGGNSPLSGVVHAVTLTLILLLFAPLADRIPLAALSAVLFVVAWNMSDVPHFIKLVRGAPRADVVILLVTFAVTVFADLVVAVNIGVTLAVLQFLRRMASSVEVTRVPHEDLTRELETLGLRGLPPRTVVFAVDGPLFFGAVEKLHHAFDHTHAEPRVVVIRLKWVPFIDATGLRSLENVVTTLRRRGVRVVLSGANPRVLGKLDRAGVLDLAGSENVFVDFRSAVASVTASDGGTPPPVDDTPLDGHAP